MFKEANNLILQYICYFFQRRSDSVLSASQRSASNQNFYIPKPKLSIFKESLSYSGPIIWNNIPSEIKSSSNLNAFSKTMVDWLIKPTSNTA